MLSVWMNQSNQNQHAASNHTSQSKDSSTEKIGRVSKSDLEEFANRRSYPAESGAA